MLEDYIGEVDETKWVNHPRVRIKKESAGDKPPQESGKVTPEMLERRKFRMTRVRFAAIESCNEQTLTRMYY